MTRRTKQPHACLWILLPLAFFVIFPIKALATVYQPGETLEPDCAPLEEDCGVATWATAESDGGYPDTDDPAGGQFYFDTTDDLLYVFDGEDWLPVSTGGVGLTSLNGQTGATQTFVTGTSGSDFAIVSGSNVHTFNIPNASASARGLVTTGAQTIGGVKTFADGITTVSVGSSGTLALTSAGMSTTGVIQIGAGGSGSTTPDLLAVDVKSAVSGVGDPAGVNGAFYYNSALGKFRCYEDDAWSNCVFPSDGSAQNLTLARIGDSTFSTLQDLQNVFHSAGFVSGGAITDAGGETIDIAEGTGLVRNSDSATAQIAYFDWGALSGVAIPTNSVRYIGVEYNGGSPQAVVRTSSNWNLKTDFSIGVVVNESGALSIYSDLQAVGDHAANMIQREYETMPLEPDTRNGGLMFDETGTRNIMLSAGAIWDRLNRYVIPSIDTSMDGTFNAYYRDGSSGFTKVSGLTQWPNAQYDDNSGTVATLAGGEYAALWFYLDTNAQVSMLYGRGAYATPALADAEEEPDSLPDRLEVFGKLLGKIVFQKSDAEATDVLPLLGMSASSSSITNHANLSGLDFDSSGHTGFANAIDGVNDTITSMTGLTTLSPGGALAITAAAASVWSTSSGVLRVDAASALNLGTTSATALNLGRAGITTTNQGNLAIAGNWTTPSGGNLTTTGTQNNVAVGTGALFRFTAASDATFTGIAGGTDGRFIRIMNASASSILYLTNADTNSSAENRILTANGATATLNPNGVVNLQYDGTTSRWRVTALPVETQALDQGGNAFGTTLSLGTTDANGLSILTSGATRFSVASGAATLTGSGATTLTSTSTTTLASASGSTLSIDSGGTGSLNVGTGANAKTITIGNATPGTAVNFNTGTGGSTITTTNGPFAVNTGTGNIDLGTDAVAKSITIGNTTGASGLVLYTGSGGGSFESSNGFTLNPYGAGSGTTELRFAELSGGNYVGFKAPDALVGDVVWTLPNADGDADEVLSTDGTGGLSWVAAGACGSCVLNTSEFEVDGDGNIVKLNNLATSFPSVQGGSGTVLTNNGSGGLTWSPVGSGSSALNDVSAATTTATIGNGNNAINWNWTLSGATNGLTISETTASTGTGYLQRVSTLATSTAKPFSVGARGTTIIDTTAAGGITIGDSATLNSPITLQSGTGAIAIGTDAVAHTITLGNSTGATALNLNSGSGGINLGANTTLTGSRTLTTGTGLTTINSTAVTLAGNDTVLDMTGTGTLELNTTTNRAITTGSGLFTAGGDFAVIGATTLSGDFVTPKGADHTVTGTQNDVDFGTGALFQYTGGGAATFTGITGGTDGRFIRISNNSLFNITFTNEDAASSEGNRIRTPGGTSVVVGPQVSIGLQYDDDGQHWHVVVLPATSTTVSAFAFVQSGNAFGATASLGTTDANGLDLITGGATRFSLASGAATLTGTGATSIGSSGSLVLDAATSAGLGTSTATSVALGRTGVTTTNNGALTSTETLTASNGLTLTTGALNLTATSGTLTLGSTTLSGASPLVFDGDTANANKTTFAITDPTGARTITFPDASVTVNAAGNISGTTLASNVVTSSLTTVGALASGSIASGFGSISTTNNISTSANVSTTGSGTVTSAGALTASNGLTLTTGALNATATSGVLSLSGLSASSINTGANNLTFTAGNFNTTATGINGTNIGTTTPGSGAFTVLSATGGTNLGTSGASNINIATAGTGNVAIGNSTGTLSLVSSGGLNATTVGALTGVASIDTIATTATGLTFAGAGTIVTTTSSALALDSGTTGAVNIGTGTNAKTITIGNTTGATALNLNAGTSNINLQTAGTSTTGNVQVGAGGSGSTTPDLFVLDVKSSSGDPSGTNGAMYYNTNTGKFRCFENSAWVNCIGSGSGSDVQHAASYDSDEALTNVPTGGAQVTLGTISLTPTTATGDIYVAGWADVYSSNGTDQPLQVVIETTSNCTGSTVGNASVTYTLTSGASTANDRGSIRVSGIAVDAGASAQPFSLCAAVTSGAGDSDILNWGIEGLVIDTGADLAEIYTTNDLDLEAGDVVSLDDRLRTGVQKSRGAEDQAVIGIVSTNPGSIIGGVDREGVKAVPVALAGRVPVKASAENGVIAVGDLLTPSSIPGVAMKSSGTGVVIGQAMSAYESDGVGFILAFVKNMNLGQATELLGNVSSDSGLSTLLEVIQTETAYNPLAIFAARIADGRQFLTDFVTTRITAVRGYFDELFARKVHSEQLCLTNTDGTETCINGDQLQEILTSTTINSLPVQRYQRYDNTQSNETNREELLSEEPTESATDQMPTPTENEEDAVAANELETPQDNEEPVSEVPTEEEDMSTPEPESSAPSATEVPVSAIEPPPTPEASVSEPTPPATPSVVTES